jgi:hypothetical protein
LPKNKKPSFTDYAVYYEPFVQLVNKDLSLTLQFKEQVKQIELLLKQITEQQWHNPYAAGKWTLAESVQHIIDVERVFQYRALKYSRNDKEVVNFIDQDAFIKNSLANKLSKAKLLREFKTVRSSTISLYNNQTAKTLQRAGTATLARMSVNACFYIMYGHCQHHIQILEKAVLYLA